MSSVVCFVSYRTNDHSRKDMLEACRESRHSGKMVEKLVEGIAVQVRALWDIIWGEPVGIYVFG